MDRKDIGCGDVDWIHLAQEKHPVADPYDDDKEPSGSAKDGEFVD
jgi:hypothetical protein